MTGRGRLRAGLLAWAMAAGALAACSGGVAGAVGAGGSAGAAGAASAAAPTADRPGTAADRTGTAADRTGTAADRRQAVQRGEQVYARCVGCHALDTHRTGPQHCGLFGRRAGTAPGFDGYSPAMRASNIVWTTASLDRFLAAPTEVVPGTTMGYAGVKDPRDRADLIAWLQEATQPGQRCRIGR